MTKLLVVVAASLLSIQAGCNQRLPATEQVSAAAKPLSTAKDSSSSVETGAEPSEGMPSTHDQPPPPSEVSNSAISAVENGSGEAPDKVSAPATQRPPADRTPRRPGEAEKVTFEDLNLGMQADVVFRPFMLLNSRAQELEGKRISISGYMHAGQSSQRGIKDFILLKNTQCKFGPGGQADHLANVVLRDGSTTTFTPSPIKVEGTLKIEPFQGPDENTWYIYRLEGAQIR